MGLFWLIWRLLGRFEHVPNATFYLRQHGKQSSSEFGVYDDGSIDYHNYTVWFAPHRSGQLMFPHWRIPYELMRSVVKSPLSLRERVMCSYRVARWCGHHRRHMLRDVRLGLANFGRKPNSPQPSSITQHQT